MDIERGKESEVLQIADNGDQGRPRRQCDGTCHANEILQSLNRDRQCGLFTDVILQVDGHKFFCHKVILSSKSSYFRAMFTNGLKESTDHVVSLQEISAPVMVLLLDFMYEGRIFIQEDNVEDILQASDLLHICSLRDECVKFLDSQLDPSNCVGIMKFADMFSITSLSEKSKKLMLEGFEEVSCHEEFLELTKEELMEYLSNDDLVVSKEEIVYEAVMRWVKENKTKGREALKDLLEHVRLPLMDPAYFLEKVEMDKTVQECPECFPLLHEARIYHILGDPTTSRRTRPRRFMEVSELIVVIGGSDQKGILKLPYIDTYDPRTGHWTSLSMFPGYTKSETAACSMKNNIYVSGEDYSKCRPDPQIFMGPVNHLPTSHQPSAVRACWGHINSRHVWMLNAQVNSWVKMASLYTNRRGHGMVALKGQIYAVGGFDGLNRLSTVERYNPFTNTWTPVTPMLAAVSSAAVVSCAKKLYVIGGAVEDYGKTDKVQCYNPEEDKWTYASPAPFCKDGVSGVEIEGTIYVVGGLMSAIFSYHPSTDTWKEEAVLPGPLESCGAAVYRGKLYIMGGRSDNGEATDRCFVFDPETKMVSEERPLLRSTSHHGCVTILQKL